MVSLSSFVRTTALAASFSVIPLFATATEITGAGASFPAPLYATWADAYHRATGKRVNYQSIGSGGGIRQITAKTVDFGATDMPLSPEILERDGLVQFPTVIGGIVPVVNVAGIKPGDLLLTGQVLADIYLGRITRWNDKAIAELNPGVSLPNAVIATIRRADGSGSTFVLTNYFSKIHAEWKSRIGEGTVVQWPTPGMGGKGNEGVSAFLQRIPNSIGYVEIAYATQNSLAWARMKNADGHIVSPSEATFKAAAEGADWGTSSFGAILTNQPGKNSWPLASATFILMHKIQDRPTQGAESLKFFDWAFRHGGQMASDLEYVPLPDSLAQSIRASWKNITDASGKPVFSSK